MRMAVGNVLDILGYWSNDISIKPGQSARHPANLLNFNRGPNELVLAVPNFWFLEPRIVCATVPALQSIAALPTKDLGNSFI